MYTYTHKQTRTQSFIILLLFFDLTCLYLPLLGFLDMAKIILGTETSYVRDLDECLEMAKDNKQDFVIIPLFHPRNRRDSASDGHRLGPCTRSDMVLESTEWISNVVGKISEVLQSLL